jgi:hypothetical protein
MRMAATTDATNLALAVGVAATHRTTQRRSGRAIHIPIIETESKTHRRHAPAPPPGKKVKRREKTDAQPGRAARQLQLAAGQWQCSWPASYRFCSPQEQ